MTDIDRAVAAMRAANPVPDAKAFHRSMTQAASRPAHLQLRSTNMDTITKLPENRRRRPRSQTAFVAAAVVLVAAVGAALIAGVQRPTWLGGGDPVDVATRYFEAFERGDVEAVLEGLSTSAETTVRHLDQPGGSAIMSLADQNAQRWLAYLLGAGSFHVDAECTVLGESASTTTVECTSALAHVTRRALGAPDLRATTTFGVAGGSITSFHEEVIASGPNTGDAYHAWMSERYPEDAAMTVAIPWRSIDQAIEAGRAEARHLDEYIRYLDDNGCPMTGC